MRPVQTAGVVAGVIALGVLSALPAADPPPLNNRQRAQAAILDLSNNLGAADVAARAKKVVEEHNSCDLSAVFRDRQRGGLGVGQAVAANRRDNVERLVIAFARDKTLTEAELEKYKGDYVRVAKVLQAMAELAPHRGEEFTATARHKKSWQDISADFKGTTAAFRQALEEADPKKVRLAAAALNETCNNCHCNHRQ